jgi:hypothetical protein
VEQLAAKPSAKFVDVIPADRLELIVKFLRQIATASGRAA